MMDRRGGLESARGLKLAYISLSTSEMVQINMNSYLEKGVRNGRNSETFTDKAV